jgi:hypothetical protein
MQSEQHQDKQEKDPVAPRETMMERSSSVPWCVLLFCYDMIAYSMRWIQHDW